MLDAIAQTVEQVLDRLAQFEVENPVERIAEIVQPIQLPTHSPFVGRPVKEGKREEGYRPYGVLVIRAR